MQLSQIRRRNKRLTLSTGSGNVAFWGILRLLLDLQSSFAYLTFKAALCYNALNEKTGVEQGSQAERSNSLKHLSEDELLDVFETARRRSLEITPY